MKSIIDLAKAAKAASSQLARSSAETRNQVLRTLADLLRSNIERILAANAQDLQRAIAQHLPEAMQKRLLLDAPSIDAMAQDLAQLATLPDPLAHVTAHQPKQKGWQLTQQRVPLGVLAIIYESRPNVTVDCAALAIKSGNGAVLRGGKEASFSNRVLIELVHQAMGAEQLPPEAIAFIDGKDRQEISELLSCHRELDLVIPRGGIGLHELCRSVSKVPVLSGGIGICHIFVDASADLKKSVTVVLNAKLQRPSACNALDVLLLHEDIAAAFCRGLQEAMSNSDRKLILHACAQSAAWLPDARLATEADFQTEWLSERLSIQCVSGLERALAHIAQYGSQHSEAILTENPAHAAQFMQRVDAAAVYHNASTRFTDGAEFGLGAEVAVSTDKLHARGPLGLDALTTYKWLGVGSYTVRD